MKAEKVGVSYSWRTEKEGPHAGTVASFCQLLEAAGVQMLLDIHEVDFGDSLTDFMKELGTSEHLCIFLSETTRQGVKVSRYCSHTEFVL